MKEGIHPNYDDAVVTCACGESFSTGSTVKNLSVDVCSKCHPFFTGKQKSAHKAGPIHKFNEKYGFSEE